MSNGDGGMSTSQSVVNEPDMLRGPGTQSSKVISSFCSADKPQCVEVEYRARTGEDDVVVVTDSKQGAGSPELTFTLTEWDAFLRGAKGGQFDTQVLSEAGAGRLRANEDGSIEAV